MWSVDGNEVIVQLDTAMVSRLVSGHSWNRNGAIRLRFSPALCSASLPPQAGREAFLDRDAILRSPSGRFDLLGDGQYIMIRLKALAANTEPQSLVPSVTLTWSERSQRRRSRA